MIELPGTRRGIPTLMVLVLSAVGTLSAGSRYKMEILPVPSGCQSFSQLHGLEGQDRVVGMMTCDGFATQRAVMWDHGVLVELGTFCGPNAWAFSVSQRGEVVGMAEGMEIYEDQYHVTRPFLWANGEIRDLGTLGGPLGAATAINASGTTVGACQPAEPDPRIDRLPSRACVWEDGTVRDLGDLGGPEVAAYDVNQGGWIVGDSNTDEELVVDHAFADHAFLYDGKTMRDLGTLGGLASLAYSINDHGDVVGFSYTGEHSSQGYPVAHGFLWRSGNLLDLGTLGGPFSQALGINNRDQIVGSSLVLQPNGSFDRRAVIWDRDSILDLNDVVSESGGWVLRDAWAIDDRGRILANATQGADWRVLVLTPTPGK